MKWLKVGGFSAFGNTEKSSVRWSHFELREYDATIGRWTATDPQGQHWSPYVGMGNNPVSGTDPNGGWDWVKNSEGRYYDDPTVNECTDLGGTGWEYVGKELPSGVNPKGLDILVKIDGAFYYKNTTDISSVAYNFFTDGPKMVEHKLYDAVAERELGEGIANGIGLGVGTYLTKGIIGLLGARGGAAAAKGVTNLIPEGKLANHLFKGAGKLADNPANRTLIQNMSNGKALVVDQFGKSWYRGLNGSGKAIYSYTQNGIVKGAGYTDLSAAEMIIKYSVK